MQFEFDLNTRLKGMEMNINSEKEKIREDRKDDRVDRQAAHQKDMIDQRTSGNALKTFESSGNDILTGGANMGRFSR